MTLTMQQFANRVVFFVVLKEVKLVGLTQKINNKLRAKIEFDNKKFKTKKKSAMYGNDDITWRFCKSFEWHLEHPSQKNLEDFLKGELLHKYMKITVTHQSKSSTYKNVLGTATTDIYNIATGVPFHNLPLLDMTGKEIARLHFQVEMEQLCNVHVQFKEIRINNLKSVERMVQGVNPYLKYAYSRQWMQVVEGKVKAIYSQAQSQAANPLWKEVDLPPLVFKASLPELVKESIVVHATHKGKMVNTTLVRANLLFRSLVANGKSFQENDLITFQGPVGDKGTEIKGTLVIKNLPRFVQMKADLKDGYKRPVRTEDGIYDARPFLRWVPRPSVPVFSDVDEDTISEKSDSKRDKERKERRERRASKKLEKEKAKEKERQENEKKSGKEEESDAEEEDSDGETEELDDTRSVASSVSSYFPESETPVVECDLIDFSSFDAPNPSPPAMQTTSAFLDAPTPFPGMNSMSSSVIPTVPQPVSMPTPVHLPTDINIPSSSLTTSQPQPFAQTYNPFLACNVEYQAEKQQPLQASANPFVNNPFLPAFSPLPQQPQQTPVAPK